MRGLTPSGQYLKKHGYSSEQELNPTDTPHFTNSNVLKLGHNALQFSSSNLEPMLLVVGFLNSSTDQFPLQAQTHHFTHLQINWICIVYAKVFWALLIVPQQHFTVSLPPRKHGWTRLHQHMCMHAHIHTCMQLASLFLFHVFPLTCTLTWFSLYRNNTMIVLMPVLYWVFSKVHPVLSTLY